MLTEPSNASSVDAEYSDESSQASVLRAASQIEPDPMAVMEWFSNVAIMELGNLTAQGLVALGSGRAVLKFLDEVRDGCRDISSFEAGGHTF